MAVKIETVQDLVDHVYNDIKGRNATTGEHCIPQSDTFFEELVKKYNMIPFTVPRLMKILTSANLVFSFNVVEKDLKNKITGIEGFVITDLATLGTLKEYYERKFSQEYAVHFNRKLDPMVAMKEYIPKMNEYNNTSVGKAANILINLIHYESRLRKEPNEFIKKRKADLLEEELNNADPLSFFITGADSKPRPKAGQRTPPPAASGDPSGARTIDSTKYADFLSFSDSQPIKKTLMVYGVEFYTRVCFREYQFHLIKQLIDENIITKKNDLTTVKKLLKKVRANADQDLKLQEFAAEINLLEKEINDKLKNE